MKTLSFWSVSVELNSRDELASVDEQLSNTVTEQALSSTAPEMLSIQIDSVEPFDTEEAIEILGRQVIDAPVISVLQSPDDSRLTSGQEGFEIDGLLDPPIEIEVIDDLFATDEMLDDLLIDPLTIKQG